MLHLHSHNFQSVLNKFQLPFQKNSFIQNEVEIEGLRIMSEHDYLFYPKSRFLQRNKHISYRVIPERVYAFATMNAILFYIRYILTFRTELL